MLEDLPDDWQHSDMAEAIKWCRKFDLAIDCGAHRGIVTNYLMQHFDKVVSIEPSEFADEINNQYVIKAALGQANYRAGLQHGKHNTGQRHLVVGDDVDVITLDSLHLAPDFIKIDIEGMEYHALLGGEQTIRTHKPIIIIEENGLNQRYGVEDGETLDLLKSWGMVEVGKRDKDHIFTW